MLMLILNLQKILNLNVEILYDNDEYFGLEGHGTWGNYIGVLPNNTANK
jgi:hypothetical protein